MVRFGKLDYLVSSAPAIVRGTVVSGEVVLLLVKWHLTKGKDEIHNNFGGCGGG
jgi:hypothetical protein